MGISRKNNLLLNRKIGRHGKITEISPFSQIISHNEFSTFIKSLLDLFQEISRNYSLFFHWAVGCHEYCGD